MDKNFPKYKLEFDDISFFGDNIDESLVDNYPTLFYFLNKNNLTFKNIKDNFNEKALFEEKENYQSFYFWIFGLRIISSINCIYLEQYTPDFVKYATNEAKVIIKDKLGKKEKFGTKWINIVLDYIDPIYEDTDVLYIYNYLKKIISYFPSIEQEFKEDSLKLIQKIIKEVFFLVFNNSLKDFFKKNIKIENKLMRFIVSPNNELKKEIEEDANENYKELLFKEQCLEDLKPFYEKFIGNFVDIIVDLEKECIKEKENTEKIFLEEKEIEREKIINDETNKMKECIDIYNKHFSELEFTINNCIVYKFNNIIRKVKTWAKDGSSIQSLIDNCNKCLEELKILKIEKEDDEKIKNEMITIVEALNNNLNELYLIDDYNKSKKLSAELSDTTIKFKKKNNSSIADYIQFTEDIINLLSKYNFRKDNILINFKEKIKLFEEKEKNLKDIMIIRNNSTFKENSDLYLNHSKDYFIKSKQYLEERDSINEEIKKKKNLIEQYNEEIKNLNNSIIEQNKEFENNIQNINSLNEKICKLNQGKNDIINEKINYQNNKKEYLNEISKLEQSNYKINEDNLSLSYYNSKQETNNEQKNDYLMKIKEIDNYLKKEENNLILNENQLKNYEESISKLKKKNEPFLKKKNDIKEKENLRNRELNLINDLEIESKEKENLAIEHEKKSNQFKDMSKEELSKIKKLDMKQL